MTEFSNKTQVINDCSEELKTDHSNAKKEQLIENLKMGTKEWASRNVNCIKGCKVGCIYCYAKAIAKHYRGYTDDSWRILRINPKTVEKGYSKSRKKTSAPWDIMFPTTHNIFIEEPYFSACIKVLKKCLKAQNTVLITIKPKLDVVKKLCKIFINYKDKIGFRFTIGSTDSKILELFEPYGSSFEERLESLKYATKMRFSTSVSAEPLLDKTPFDLVDKIIPHLSVLDRKKDIGTIWIGLLKKKYIPRELRRGEIKTYLENLEKSFRFKHIFLYYKPLYSNKRIKWKESILKLMISNNIKVKLE
ncbi:MAG: hypothetical protein GF311_18915 [Candidatus Lokiarchaeota archaeon]|nr:hypothetical protein [Candidatus Lokiarchaeota archaeon]